MNTPYIIAMVSLGLTGLSIYLGSRQKDDYGDTTGTGIVLLMAGVGFLFTAGLFAMIGVDIQYPGIMTQ